MSDQRIGAIEVQVHQANAAACNSVGYSATVVTLLAAAAGRLGGMICNAATVTLYVKFGSGASTSSYTVAIFPGGYYEFPAPVYAGLVTGIWAASGSGNAIITEMT